MKTKCCTKCGIEKELSEFYKDKRRNDGHMSACKKCHIRYNKNQIAYKANWYQENKERLDKKSVIYNKNYRTNIKPWFTSFDKAKQRCTNPNDDSYKWYGGRGIEFKLTMDEVEFLWFRDKAYLMDKPTIDRLDSDGHYELSNCQFLEKTENSRKAGKRRGKVKNLRKDNK